MERHLSVLTRGFAGLLCLGLLSACGDRMGAFKANRISCEQYNTWARQNNQPLRCGAGINNKPTVKSEAGNILEDVQANVPANVTPAVETPAAPKAEAGQQPGAEAKVVAPSEQRLARPYVKADWIQTFETLMKSKDKAAVDYVKGININAGVDKESGELAFDLSAVVQFNGTPMYLFSNPKMQLVRFDKESMMNMQIEVRKTLGSKPEILSNDLIASATCLAEEKPCKRFGLVLDFKTAKGDRAWAVFEVGVPKEGGAQFRILDSNLKEELKSFEEGQKVISAEAAPSQLKVTVDGGSKQETKSAAGMTLPKETEMLKGAQAAAGVIAQKRNAAEDAAQAAEAAHKANDAAKAEEQAKIAEEAAKSAEEANKIVVDWMGQLKALDTKPETAKAADQVINDSAKQVEEAKNFANGARINANYAKASADANGQIAANAKAKETASAEQVQDATTNGDDQVEAADGTEPQP